MREHKRPAPMLTSADDINNKYIAAVCPACGKYPGGDGWQVCQYCDRWVEAHSSWTNDSKGCLWKLVHFY